RRATKAIVVARHRLVVSAGGVHRENVTDLRRSNLRFFDQHVGFAMLAGDSESTEFAFRRAAGVEAEVLGVVQRRTRVVAQAAIDRNVSADAGNFFDRADFIQRGSRFANERAARLDGQTRYFKAKLLAVLINGTDEC